MEQLVVYPEPPPPDLARTLDLGTGCGIQALHASRFSGRVIATDISQPLQKGNGFIEANAALEKQRPSERQLRRP